MWSNGLMFFVFLNLHLHLCLSMHDSSSPGPARGEPRGGEAGLPRARPRGASSDGTMRTRCASLSGEQNFGKMLLVFGCIGSDFCKKKYTSASRKRVTRGRAGHKGVLRPRDKRKRSEGRSSRWFPEKAEAILCRRRPVHYCDRRVERGIS